MLGRNLVEHQRRGAAVRHSLSVLLAAILVGVFVLSAGMCSRAVADEQDGPSHGRRGPVYQRHAFDGGSFKHGPQHDGGRRGQSSPANVSQVNAGWFQRPYPYHLDYYRMRYGGSYAPYFGNLYGPPQVVTAPPYYGPYYGGYGYGGAFGYDPTGVYGTRPECCPCEPGGEEQPSGRAGEQQSGSGEVE